MKKTVLYILVFTTILTLALPFVVSAAPWGGPNRPDRTAVAPPAPTLTLQQVEELRPLYQQLIDVHKQILQKYVDYGYITQNYADQRVAWMQQMMEYRLQNGYGPGFGMMGGGPGMMDGFGHGAAWCPGYYNNTSNKN